MMIIMIIMIIIIIIIVIIIITATLGTAHKLREVLIYKNRTHFTCEITLHVAQNVRVITEQLQQYMA